MYAGHQPSRTAIVPQAADGQSADRSGSLQLPLPFLKAGPAGGRLRRPSSAAEPLVRSFGKARTCAANGCDTQALPVQPRPALLSPQGWDLEQRTRGRRRVAGLPVALTTADD